jgi:hypothetical protein
MEVRRDIATDRKLVRLKLCGRYQVDITPPEARSSHSGVEVVATRKGIEVSAYYDDFIGIEGGFISWKWLDLARRLLASRKEASADV